MPRKKSPDSKLPLPSPRKIRQMRLPIGYTNAIRKFRDWLRGPLTVCAIHRYFVRLEGAAATKLVAKYALKRVIKQELLEQNRMEDLKRMEICFGDIKPGALNRQSYVAHLLKEKDMARIKKSGDERTALIFRILYQTGLRISELARIQHADCAMRGNTVCITVTGKGGKHRRVILAKSLHEQARRAFDCPTHLIGKRSGGAYTPRHLRRMVSDCEAILGKRVWPHLIRHSFATETIHRTGKIKAVSEYLGHADPATTLRMYVHEKLTSADLRI